MKNFMKMANAVSKHAWKNFKHSKDHFPKFNGDAVVSELERKKPMNTIRRKKHVIFTNLDMVVQND